MTKKLLAVLLALAMLFTACACAGKTNNTNNANNAAPQDDTEAYRKEFAAFVEEQYIHSIEDSYSTLHIYYLDPEAAGMDLSKVDISMGLAPDDAKMQEDRDYYDGLKKKLESFDREKLSRDQQDEYDCLKWEIDSVIALTDKKFDYYDQIFAPPNSLDANLVSIMSTWEMRNEREVGEFITYVKSIPAYVDSALEYAKKQQEKQLLMTDFDQIKAGCEDVIEIGMDSFIVDRLLGQIDALEGIAADKKETYKKDLRDAIETCYLPVFTKIRDTFESMRGGYNNEKGYAALPNGAEYFEVLLNYALGTYGMSAEDYIKEINNRINGLITEIQGIYLEDPDAIDDFYDNDPDTGYASYEAILEDVRVKMLADYPEIKDLQYEIKKADEEEKLEEKSIAAYFVVPPLDGSHKQQMRVNPENEDMSSVDTFMTVTHEGFPGHMYQYAYQSESGKSDYIKTLEVTGMVEGYAVYAQYCALAYADVLSKSYGDLMRINEAYTYLDYGNMDIGINYKGWDEKDLLDYLTESGYGVNEEITHEIYNLLRLTPTYYEPYGIGYSFIAAERARAEKALGDKFSTMEFNRALLNASSTPRTVISRYIDEYIDSAKPADNTNTNTAK